MMNDLFIVFFISFLGGCAFTGIMLWLISGEDGTH